MKDWMIAAGIFGAVFGVTYGWVVGRLSKVSDSMRLTPEEERSYNEELEALRRLER